MYDSIRLIERIGQVLVLAILDSHQLFAKGESILGNAHLVLTYENAVEDHRCDTFLFIINPYHRICWVTIHDECTV